MLQRRMGLPTLLRYQKHWRSSIPSEVANVLRAAAARASAGHRICPRWRLGPDCNRIDGDIRASLVRRKLDEAGFVFTAGDPRVAVILVLQKLAKKHAPRVAREERAVPKVCTEPIKG